METLKQQEREKLFNSLVEGDIITLIPQNQKGKVITKTDAITVIENECGDRYFFFKLKIYFN
jgi:hypothetical protein